MNSDYRLRLHRGRWLILLLRGAGGREGRLIQIRLFLRHLLGSREEM